MNGRNDPLSPVSVGDSEWSGIGRYQAGDSDGPYSASNPAGNRGQLASPPISTGSSSTMNGGFQPRGSSSGSPGSAPSPPSSVARSSVGTGLYAGSESGRSRKDEQFEGTLSEHYVALKRYLAASLRDEKGNPRVNRARDKLLRLSAVQFQELSTDVFDELLRRQQNSRRPPNGPPDAGPPDAGPQFLLPKDTFHPKRNQARQKLSTLPPPRFRDLATDVFFELERRFPRFAGGEISRMGSPASMRNPPSRNGNGTPVNGLRMRRPSDASSVAAYSMRSESRNGPRPMMNGGLGPGIPPSPGIPPNDFGRPTPKTFQSNTIVPNKSTMVEDDETGGEEDEEDADAFGLEGAAGKRESKKSSGGSETDKKLIDDYQSQVAELREKLDAMEDNLKQKDDELNAALDSERSQSTAAGLEKKEWAELRIQLESKLADAQNLSESLQSELERTRASQSNIERDLRAQIEELRAELRELQVKQAAKAESREINRERNPRLEEENEELRSELREQQKVAEEVRRETQEFLREMRVLSERTESSYEREEQLSNTVNRLEEEVRDWRNRYARTKTQLRTLRASSIGLAIQQDAAQYTKDGGLTQANGMVKDVHVTKFQISIDEILRTARSDEPARVIDFMKAVVVNVRSITQDIDDSPPVSGEMAQLQLKLKSRVSATANNLITASKNFVSANGLSPVSLLDAAASHLTAAVVELVRTVKIRPTPVGEFEDDDDGNLEPVDVTGFFPVRGTRQETSQPPFQGLRNGRTSGDSSMYSPINSPRQSAIRPGSSGKEMWAGRQRSVSRTVPNVLNGMNGMNGNNNKLPVAPMGVGFGIRTEDSDVEELKIYLEDQTALLVQNIQALVQSIRSELGITSILNEIVAISDVVGPVVSAFETTMSSTANGSLRLQAEPVVRRLAGLKQRLIEAGEIGRAIADDERDDEEGERAWRSWTSSLPPIAFQIAHETKDLVTKVDMIDSKQGQGGRDDDFS